MHGYFLVGGHFEALQFRAFFFYPRYILKDFSQLELIDPILRAVKEQKYVQPTPIQAEAIPALLNGRDVLGCAQTGTGKTAAFALPVLQHLAADKPKGRRNVRALILSPTRELAGQIGESFQAYGKHLDLRTTTVFGGVSERRQIRALERGIDILVACPGRLLDLHGRGFVDLSNVEYFILDEADRMLDMGFVPDVRRIIKAMKGSKRRQNLLFSATMPQSVVKLASSFLHDPLRIDITPETTAVEAVDQHVMYVDKSKKTRLLCDLLVDRDVRSTIVFMRTKRRANKLTRSLEKAGFKAKAIHGNKSQNARQKALNSFQNGHTQVLVATNVAARGIDVDHVSHVFNFDIPNDPKSYVHRIGRTGRAGRTGSAISFCAKDETKELRAIEKNIGEEISTDKDHAFHQEQILKSMQSSRGNSGGGGGGGRKYRRTRSSSRRRSR